MYRHFFIVESKCYVRTHFAIFDDASIGFQKNESLYAVKLVPISLTKSVSWCILILTAKSTGVVLPSIFYGPAIFTCWDRSMCFGHSTILLFLWRWWWILTLTLFKTQSSIFVSSTFIFYLCSDQSYRTYDVDLTDYGGWSRIKSEYLRDLYISLFSCLPILPMGLRKCDVFWIYDWWKDYPVFM